MKDEKFKDNDAMLFAIVMVSVTILIVLFMQYITSHQ
jgi:hypothetical protein